MDSNSVIICLVAFLTACLLLCFGFHPKVFVLVMSSCMFFDVAFPASSAVRYFSVRVL